MKKEECLRAFIVTSVISVALISLLAWLFSWHIAISIISSIAIVAFLYWLYLK